ncbi:MAG: Brp/Blh family beta-carotene 15,15'-dioxygenase [Haliscomenobacter sp.]|uniref:Brp/Blh family beta-carotene 15,15'-dioxygenase n=1 Tax=Haliscomenobacter sp. TaxID=2717303 RepID=UPI0029A3D236|nr:Brp/Blh family beta-carotene 15,15'-dioxygenase [Haliscomenobacter sp.]MDX2071631.1 Brp/Blh family beta-carotene 15,15'-dioxygenase [Haliscomenobacter sp.]
MTARYPHLYFWLRLFSLLLAAIVILLPALADNLSLFLALFLIIGLGIPHGATDHRIFHVLLQRRGGQPAMLGFYGGYLGLMLVYGLLWWLSPALGLLIFLLTSVYHFGQSNWNYVNLNSGFQALLYLIHGAFVLFLPILAHFKTAQPIVESIIQRSLPELSALLLNGSIGLIIVLNLLTIGLLWLKRELSNQEAWAEVFNLFILLVLFVSTPLLLGFALYFSAWHALSSIQDQISFFRSQKPGYKLKDYVREALPYSGLAILGLMIMVWYSPSIQMNATWGILFIFLSLVTLPHLVLIEMLYQTGQSDKFEWRVDISE